MAGKKDQAVTAVISGLTRSQAIKVVGEIQKAKVKCAPMSRGTVAWGSKESVGRRLKNENQKLLK